MQDAPLDTIVTAETPEGIALELRTAGYVARSQAYLIDLLARFGILYAGLLVLGTLRGVGMALILITVFVLNWLYPVIFELLPGAATPGKRTMGLMVVMDNGLPITPAASLVRNLLRAADFMPVMYGCGVATMLARKDGKRLGDLAAGTLVIYKPKTPLPAELPAAEPTPPAVPLSPRDQASIIAFATRVPRLTPERAEELAQLAKRVLPAGAAAGAGATVRLLAVAQWLHGSREARAP